MNRPWYNLTLIGGEPTIHPHIVDLISMFHERFGKRFNRLLIATNGSQNPNLYKKISDISKSVQVHLSLSLHTDHVKMDHIFKLIEDISEDVSITFALMFNPDKREKVYEIYDMLLEKRKKFSFGMTIDLLRAGDRVDPRHTPEDFAWQKQAVKQFGELVKSVAPNFPPRKKTRYSNPVIRDVEDNGEIKTVGMGNRSVALADGLLNFKGMHCIAHVAVLRIQETGRFLGMVCNDDHTIGNIFEKDAIMKVRDKLIHSVKCTHNLCGCPTNYIIPKFASEEDAKKYVEFAQERQAQLFAEYDAQQALAKA